MELIVKELNGSIHRNGDMYVVLDADGEMLDEFERMTDARKFLNEQPLYED